MDTDYSKQIYDHYYSLKNRTLKITLKNKRQIEGVICGFFRGDADRNEPYIIKWHIVGAVERNMFGTNILGCITGEIIKQSDILEVRFSDDTLI